MSAGMGTLGHVMVQALNGRGATPEELADRALDKIIAISETAPLEIKMQAQAYREQLRVVLVDYMKQAIRSHNTTVSNRLTQRGHADLAVLLEI